MNVREPSTQVASANPMAVRMIALERVPLVSSGDDLTALIAAALDASGEVLCDGDVIVIAQKIVSKAHGRLVRLTSVQPSTDAEAIARETNKDPRLVELILRESTEVVRRRRDVLIVAHKLGFVAANAGIDLSNVEQNGCDDIALLLPEDPDKTCAELREQLKTLTAANVAVIINDSHGRAFRNGTVGVAIGASGLPALDDRRGDLDLYHRPSRSTEVALADEIASAASLLMGQAGESRPIVVVRGLAPTRRDGSAAELIRPKETDLFRLPTADDLLRRRRSIRHYSDRLVPDRLLQEILEIAAYAPSAHNRQPWRFVVLKDAASKGRLAHDMADRLRADRGYDGDPADAIEKDAFNSIKRIIAAPVVIVVNLTVEDMDEYSDSRRANAEHQMAVQSTAMAMQNLILAAHARDLGVGMMCAPLFCPDTVRATLDLPDRWEPQALLTLGYPSNAGKPVRRRPIGDFVRTI